MSEQSHYEVLGVPKDADENTIKKAYRKLAMQHHPDKGGDPAVFNRISTANEVLSDKEKRRLYDLGGSEAVERGHHGHEGGMGGMEDLFGFMGGGRRPQQPRGPTKGDPVIFPLELTLNEMYSGTSKKLRLTRSVICESCEGKGGSQVTECRPCQGRGVRVVVQRLGPGMISQSQQTCHDCQGQGKVIHPQHLCQGCQGQKTVKQRKEIEVTVPPGARPEQTVVFTGEGDHLPNQLAGDMIINFQQKSTGNHRVQRRGHHLYLNQKISLLQALTGFSMDYEQLDGRIVKITSNDVIKPGDIMCIENEGFPHSFGEGRGIDVGNLYITFEIEFPTTQQIRGNPQKAKQNITNLKTVLPNQSYIQPVSANAKGQVSEPKVTIVDMAVEEKKQKVEEQRWNSWLAKQSKSHHAHDDDDDEGPVHMSMGGNGCQGM